MKRRESRYLNTTDKTLLFSPKIKKNNHKKTSSSFTYNLHHLYIFVCYYFMYLGDKALWYIFLSGKIEFKV